MVVRKYDPVRHIARALREKNVLADNTARADCSAELLPSKMVGDKVLPRTYSVCFPNSDVPTSPSAKRSSGSEISYGKFG